MKRYILIVVVAALAAVSCSKTYEHNKSEAQSIGFGTWTEVMTKAVTPDDVRKAGDNHFKTGDSFAVYGYKSKSSESVKETVFDDDPVVATADNGTDATTWDYNNHRFWDVNFEKYTFFGVSPSSLGTGGTVNPQTGEISTVVEFAGNNNDILIANKTSVAKGDSPYFNNYGTVNLVFNHAASLVDFIVKKSPALDGTTVNVTAFQLENINSKGTLAVTAYGADSPYKPTIALANWTGDGSTTATYNTTKGATSVSVPVVVNTDTAFPGDDASDVPAGTHNMVINNLVVMPQEFATTGTRQQIKMTYTITTTDGSSNTSTNTYSDKILYLSDFDNIDDKDQGGDTHIGSWEPGKHYIFYITIDANEIKFSAEINDWETTVINGYNYLVN